MTRYVFNIFSCSESYLDDVALPIIVEHLFTTHSGDRLFLDKDANSRRFSSVMIKRTLLVVKAVRIPDVIARDQLRYHPFLPWVSHFRNAPFAIGWDVLHAC